MKRPGHHGQGGPRVTRYGYPRGESEPSVKGGELGELGEHRWEVVEGSGAAATRARWRTAASYGPKREVSSPYLTGKGARPHTRQSLQVRNGRSGRWFGHEVSPWSLSAAHTTVGEW